MTRPIALTFVGALLLFAAALYVPGASADRDLSPELVEQCLVVARDVDPDLADRLVRIRNDSGDPAFSRALRNARHLVHLARIKDQDPRLYDVKVKSLQAVARANRLVEQIAEARRSGSTVSAEELEKDLNAIVEEQVALDLAARGMAIVALREHVKTLTEQLNAELSSRDQTIKLRQEQWMKRVDVLAGED